MGGQLVIRADAGLQTGTGHIMRCLALAQAWQAASGQVVFESYCQSEALRRQVRSAGIGLVPLDKPHPDPADLQNTFALMRELDVGWLVLDGYHFDPAYQQAVRAAGYRLLVIDDTAHWPEYHADILLNQNINAGQLSYVCDPDTRLLLGTRYALLRSEFMAWRGWRREVPDIARKVLVTLGGSDPDNVTLKVIQALQQVGVPELEARIVVGSANPHLPVLRWAVQRSTCNLQLLTNVTDMPALMAWADVAVSAGGSTCWELAYMGVPSIVLVLAENQSGAVEGLQQAGIAVNLGWFNQVSVSEIIDTLADLSCDSEWRHRMNQAGQELVDGYGAKHVVRATNEHDWVAR